MAINIVKVKSPPQKKKKAFTIPVFVVMMAINFFKLKFHQPPKKSVFTVLICIVTMAINIVRLKFHQEKKKNLIFDFNLIKSTIISSQKNIIIYKLILAKLSLESINRLFSRF